jgi:hypothetical protein
LMAEEKEAPAREISKDEMKFLVKAIWRCLQAPAWTKDSLITLGKVIFAKKSLKEMDDKTFAEIWPHLKFMAETLDATMTEEASRRATEAIESAEKDQQKPAEKEEPKPTEKEEPKTAETEGEAPGR